MVTCLYRAIIKNDDNERCQSSELVDITPQFKYCDVAWWLYEYLYRWEWAWWLTLSQMLGSHLALSSVLTHPMFPRDVAACSAVSISYNTRKKVTKAVWITIPHDCKNSNELTLLIVSKSVMVNWATTLHTQSKAEQDNKGRSWRCVWIDKVASITSIYPEKCSIRLRTSYYIRKKKNINLILNVGWCAILTK